MNKSREKEIMNGDVESSSPSTDQAPTPPTLPSIEIDLEKTTTREHKITLTAQ
jgi:hypothetical protein